MILHTRFIFPGIACLLFLLLAPAPARGGALEDYVQQPDKSYSWKLVSSKKDGGFTVARLELISQKWRESVWKHNLLVVRPKTIRNPDIGLLYVTGSGTGDAKLKVLEMLAERAGAVTAIITDVPNQPLYDGKSEDALIAYTFSQYVRTGDSTWPLLFPMVKSAVRALDAMQEFTKKEFDQKIERFVITGASKRGWTTWLTAAADKRVAGIAPMVIDVLNMKAQAEWQKTVYGKQSEMINDYKNADLLSRMDEPPMLKLREWVDPYSYRSRYNMPKLLLLGTNDPYWTVDSLRLYWNDLPGPKLIYQTPNAGHDLNGGHEAMQTLAAFYEMIADHQPLPKMNWQIDYSTNGLADINVKLDGANVKSALLWTATSTDRDFRNDRWSSQELKLKKGTAHTETTVQPPQAGYRAFLVEADLISSGGHPYKLSTQARVTPDTSLPSAKP
ncbi:MAG: PhoPQ-activated pathogenicity-like protein PqaA type [Pedosphaera sp.]|nr:PhoPQ-activated pathogenicity-like protein PqaA type [Pedosphaera sp.]